MQFEFLPRTNTSTARIQCMLKHICRQFSGMKIFIYHFHKNFDCLYTFSFEACQISPMQFEYLPRINTLTVNIHDVFKRISWQFPFMKLLTVTTFISISFACIHFLLKRNKILRIQFEYLPRINTLIVNIHYVFKHINRQFLRLKS